MFLKVTKSDIVSLHKQKIFASTQDSSGKHFQTSLEDNSSKKTKFEKKKVYQKEELRAVAYII